MTCKICQLEFSTPKSLHGHIAKKHDITTENYYHQHYPRFDLWSGEPIKYEGPSYFTEKFTSRSNMVMYLKKYPEKAAKLATELLKARKESKNLVFAPSTVESRTCLLPSPLLLKNLGCDYNSICESAGLTKRFDYDISFEYDEVANLEIFVDTREQKPLPFKQKVRVTKLDFGDYTAATDYRKIYIERKSLIDLCGTLSKGYDRFCRSIERCGQLKSSLIICTESSLVSATNFMHLPETQYVKASPKFIFHRVREISQKYPWCQFLFVSDRKEMTNVIPKILLARRPLTTVDLQFEYDSKTLTL